MRPNLPPHNHTRDSQSIDEGLLNLPSPYHDDFSLPPTPSTPRNPFTSYLPTFFHRFAYRTLPAQDSSPSPSRPSRRTSHVHWPDSPSPHRSNWLIILSLALLFSLLTNAFFLSERRRDYTTAALPHDSFGIRERGKNHTCYRTHETGFERADAYERLDSAHDRYWEELLGGSGGYVRTGVEQVGGRRGKRVRFGMFHQLECLGRVRGAVVAHVSERKNGRRKGKGKGRDRRKDFVVIGDGDGVEEELGRCLDYLRQSVLCGADDTLERENVMGDATGRKCRDEKWLYEVTKCGEEGCDDRPVLL